MNVSSVSIVIGLRVAGKVLEHFLELIFCGHYQIQHLVKRVGDVLNCAITVHIYIMQLRVKLKHEGINTLTI